MKGLEGGSTAFGGGRLVRVGIERPEEGLECPELLVRQPERLEFACPDYGHWGLVVVREERLERWELAGVHEWRSLRDAAQRGRPEGAKKLWVVGGNELQLG